MDKDLEHADNDSMGDPYDHDGSSGMFDLFGSALTRLFDRRPLYDRGGDEDVVMLVPRLGLQFSAAAWKPVVGMTNCYSYALTAAAHGQGAPGQLLNPPHFKTSVIAGRDVTIEDLRGLLDRDGLVRVSLEHITPAENHLVAVAYEPGMDYHFYRRDGDGTWSHKAGRCLPSNIDGSGHLIASPEECDRGPYHAFVGYFVVPNTGILYRKDNRIFEFDLPEPGF